MATPKLPQLLATAKREGWAQYVRTEADERAVLNGCRFDAAAADRVVKFFSFLRHSKGQFAGKPFDLQTWQSEDIIRPLFGWKRASGTRRFRHAYIEIPKKNGKSTMCAGIGLYLLVGDQEPGAEVYCAAADREQAAIVYNEAANMVEASPPLSARLTVRRSVKTIGYPGTRSLYKCLSSEAASAEGKNIHGLIFDELHAQGTRELWDTLRYGGAARRQPLMVAITTAGYDRHSICWEQHDYAKKVLESVIPDDEFFGYIAAAGEEDDWTKPETWRKANPSLGITMNEEGFAADCREAQESPAKENSFKRYRLNIWTEQAVRWLRMDRWDACGVAPVDPAALKGRRCYAALDLSSTTDITALVLLFPDDAGGYQLLVFFWVPAENARERERRDRVPYMQWIKEGHIEATAGDVIDYDVIRRRINELGELYDIEELAIDRWNATQITTQLEGDGFTMIPFGQGFASMSAPSKELEKLVLGGKIAHGRNPVLRWMATNVSAKGDAAGNLKPDKETSTERIDGIVATIMALGRAMVRPERKTVYETRGVLTL